jgi:hypothetical protein
VTVQRRHGARRRIGVWVRVPRSLKAGKRYRVTLRGGSGGFSEDALIEELIALFEDEGGAGSEPRTVRQLARRIHALRHVPGIYARFGKRPSRLVRRSHGASYEGRVRLRLRVTPRAR